MQIILNTLEIAFVIFLVWNARLLVFLTKPPLDGSLATCFLHAKPRQRIKISGVFYGYINGNIVLEDPSIYGDIWLQPKPHTVLIPRNLRYGDQVMVQGKLRESAGHVVLYPTDVICINNRKKILKELDKRLSISTGIAIILEVIYYVVLV